ncbi:MULTISPECIES: LacI family DNA-binding transcriptional regulator [unclassified Modestobacter]|uniref:LacI family DNA-binding transcriptional regulator n=1 Tax=unclassified Modestobacter TaxID=2643866 RepID=UPI0022AA2A80|nr:MULTISPECIES: LacI family DNA-binding transcriptional regulator [unclassified Modestobacter]MCZ2809837.1 LacI family DNA-binding transcriptional regulator [Modestobacter sp. VKM Ac-2979]MCZ2842748.1 LacI family DNA-binding transcriptional regulator [Modestobacter sp. VKM Ac-2980]MCZ2847362.1 LacI family DNA-binding transcriptional regulator [Modestobacter sp. VKM Ac-2978]
MVATLHDVARLAGVSFKTVSNVVNDYPHVRPSTRQRVQEAIAELGYQPNLSARSLRSGRSDAISLAVPELRLPYFAELADEVIRAAERRGLVVLIEQTNRDRKRELDLLGSARLRMVDGLLFSPLGLSAEDASLVEIDTPLVLLGERIFHPSVDHVTMQNVAAARAATEHLLARGRRRIAVVGSHPGEVIGSAGLRLQGYRAALDAAGIPFDERLLGPAELWHRREGAEAAQALIASGVDFDAVFAFNDTLALGAMHALIAAGRRVPDDVAVIGFDNTDDGMFSQPTLTTVDPGRREIAERAVEAVVQRIADRGIAPQHVEVGYSIVQREST